MIFLKQGHNNELELQKEKEVSYILRGKRQAAPDVLAGRSCIANILCTGEYVFSIGCPVGYLIGGVMLD